MRIPPYLVLFNLMTLIIAIIAFSMSAIRYLRTERSESPRKQQEVTRTMKFNEILYSIALVFLIVALFATSIHVALFLAMLILSGLIGGIGWLMKGAE